MNAQQMESVIQQEEINHQVKRKISNLTDSLIVIAGITEGRQLIEMIGAGHERSNTEALHTWVAFELKHCGLCEDNQLDYLYARLMMVLGDFTPSSFQ